MNNPSEARINYDRALSLDAGTVHASAASFRRLAKELRDLKKIDEALTAVSIGSSIHPKNGLLYEDAGDLHVSLGARDEALELYRQARALLPKRKELKNKIDRLKKR